MVAAQSTSIIKGIKYRFWFFKSRQRARVLFTSSFLNRLFLNSNSDSMGSWASVGFFSLFSNCRKALISTGSAPALAFGFFMCLANGRSTDSGKISGLSRGIISR